MRYKSFRNTQISLYSFGFKHPIWNIEMYKNIGDEKMTTVREAARAYEPKQTKNISDLKEVSTESEIYHGSFTNKDDELVEYQYIKVDKDEYRMPDMVLKQLKAILEEKPDMVKYKVKKSGEGLRTSYQVIPLD